MGLYGLVQAKKRPPDATRPTSWRRLVLTGAGLSIDNLVVGFGLGAQDVSVVVAAVVIAVVSVAMSLVGLELGRQLGSSVEKWSAEIGAGVLVLVGVLIAAGVL